MDWFVFIMLSPLFIFAFIGVSHLLWKNVLNPYLANYFSFNGPNRHWRSSGAVVKLTYKQWYDFAAIKPEAFVWKTGIFMK